MSKSANSKEGLVLEEMQDSQRAGTEQTAKLRALRLARDAEAKKVAAGDADTSKKRSQLPQVHRRQS